MLIILSMLLLAGLPSAFAEVNDAPHNSTNDIGCTSCHSYSLWWQFSPSLNRPLPDNHATIVNRVCSSCHGASGFPFVREHSSKGMGNLHRTALGDWARPCTACHDPHQQAQLYWYGTADSELFLVTGSMVAATLNNNENSTSTFQYSGITAKQGWDVPTDWPNKSGQLGRGLILVVFSVADGESTYEITGVDDILFEITVQGKIDLSLDGANFGVIYGQLIKHEINGVSDIKFFDPYGGDFVDTVNNKGLCQVCHTSTNHFMSSDSNPAADHLTATDNKGKTGAEARCTYCHLHVRGFAPGSDSGKHSEHLASGMPCNNCHANGIPNPLTSILCDDCHHDGLGGTPNITDYRANWANENYNLSCDGCHDGRAFLDLQVMASNGHDRLVGENWIRNYHCTFCHNRSVDAAWVLSDNHANGTLDVEIDPQWAIAGLEQTNPPTFDPVTKICGSTYCHSDGTLVTSSSSGDQPDMRPYAWDSPPKDCNACHGHKQELGECEPCHNYDGRDWTQEQMWMSAMPMYENQGPGHARANSHLAHIFKGYSCEECHALTIDGPCTTCHSDLGLIGSTTMRNQAHVDGTFHVNGEKNVKFQEVSANYDPATKSCSSTACHTNGIDPIWGASIENTFICYECHFTTAPDVDDFDAFNGNQARINSDQWTTSGHGRPLAAGNYPVTDNPPADFPTNGCWYCHDKNILHQDPTNPFRLKQHQQFSSRFEKECIYCHMEGLDSECFYCHNKTPSLAPQLIDIVSPEDHSAYVDEQTSCVALCHPDDASRHKTDTGIWTPTQKDEIRNSYLMMGVCLKCHDDDSSNQCTTCHTAPPEDPTRYDLGYDPGLPDTGFITATTSKASSIHFGYKHYAAFESQGIWKGGKFCWDCHDPHGDGNIYMIHDKVATETDGTFGQPLSQADVVFTDNRSGLDFARTSKPYNGICNVCHTESGQHYRFDAGDGHNASRVCTSCHEHRFTDSHSSGQQCNTCHQNKPVPRHSGFAQPRDCTKCHNGTVGMRMDVIGQFKAKSHHVQGVEISNKHCYACHWEATPLGLINLDYHSGYNYKTHASIENAEVDLVIWGPGTRPTVYDNDGQGGDDTAVTFLASNLAVGLAEERAEIEKTTSHCLSCHSDQNNNTKPFNDCRVPRQYAWDGMSIASRYENSGTATWGKYTGSPNAAKKDISKAFSAHGNAVNNAGGWNSSTGLDTTIPNTRNGSYNIQCFDCHSSHGSKVSGITTSYVTFNGTKNGGNMKETQAGKGGYAMTYKASSYPDPQSVNPYNAGAGQCFDCHETSDAGTTPWGYSSTFGATEQIKGYRDNPRFIGPYSQGRFAYRSGKSIMGGHLNASSDLTNSAMGAIDGLCSPCHDPHGVSPSLGNDMAYAVPMLKGTWLTSPYKEDFPNDKLGLRGTAARTAEAPYGGGRINWRTDRNTFGGTRIAEEENQFAGLCLQCHPKSNLTDGINKNTAFKTLDRIHESVKGWGNNAEHSYPCAKCHQPHASGLPRLLQTNCLNSNHQGLVESGGTYANDGPRRFPRSTNSGWSCHESPGAQSGAWYEQGWNVVTPW